MVPTAASRLGPALHGKKRGGIDEHRSPQHTTRWQHRRSCGRGTRGQWPPGPAPYRLLRMGEWGHREVQSANVLQIPLAVGERGDVSTRDAREASLAEQDTTMDFELSPTQRRSQEIARAFAQDEVAPLARAADETGTFSHALVKRMAVLGLLGGPLAPEFGGAGMDHVSFALVCEELGQVDSSVRGFLTVHAGLVAGCIQDWGTKEQQRSYLPRLASGELIGCYCLTEPEAGSDVASMRTTARQE